MLTFFAWIAIWLGLLLAVMVMLWTSLCLGCALSWMRDDLVAPAFDFGGRG
ncbi:hypothetical protein [Sagittula salina]|uniref:Uncharacterized protein n=1 Tax=Sagittula salina TaxID=2820268 RepID=A0A940MW59_9RHOB|nr:hypothetical protein [Sagittula salina]MBP0483974.1 hypothetical protein [Sagittula salina]